MTWREKLRNTVAEFKIRINRGTGLTSWVKSLIIFTAGFKVLFKLNDFQTLIAGIIGIFVLFLIGWLDLNWWKLAQREAELNTEKYNPYFERLSGAVMSKQNI